MQTLQLDQKQMFPNFDVAGTLKSIVKTVSLYNQNYKLNKKIKNLQMVVMTLSSSAHETNAKLQSIRDFVELYKIENLDKDIAFLDKLDSDISDHKDEIENILDSVNIEKIDTLFKTTLLDAYEELYGTLINIEFSISQKIARGFMDRKT